MTLLLAGDIGGTKTILRLAETLDSSVLHTIYQESYHSADFPDLVPIVQQFLVKANTRIPEKACFAIAGPIVQKYCQTNQFSLVFGYRTSTTRIGYPAHFFD